MEISHTHCDCFPLSCSPVVLLERRGGRREFYHGKDKGTARRESQYFEEEVKTLLGSLGHTNLPSPSGQHLPQLRTFQPSTPPLTSFLPYHCYSSLSQLQRSFPFFSFFLFYFSISFCCYFFFHIASVTHFISTSTTLQLY